MNKELEALNRIKKIEIYKEEDYYDPNDERTIGLSGYEYQGTVEEEYANEIDIIETTLKKYDELTSKPVILYGRTHGHTKALIDTICKNYKEVKITNLEDEKKLKALEITSKYDLKKSDITRFETYEDFIKEMYLGIDEKIYGECPKKEEYDLLKEVLL